jgi:hypothetical protein
MLNFFKRVLGIKHKVKDKKKVLEEVIDSSELEPILLQKKSQGQELNRKLYDSTKEKIEIKELRAKVLQKEVTKLLSEKKIKEA